MEQLQPVLRRLCVVGQRIIFCMFGQQLLTVLFRRKLRTQAVDLHGEGEGRGGEEVSAG